MTENSEPQLDHQTLLGLATQGEPRALDEVLVESLPREVGFT